MLPVAGDTWDVLLEAADRQVHAEVPVGNSEVQVAQIQDDRRVQDFMEDYLKGKSFGTCNCCRIFVYALPFNNKERHLATENLTRMVSNMVENNLEKRQIALLSPLGME